MNMQKDYKSPKFLSWLAMAGVVLVTLCTIFAGLIGVAQVINPERSIELDEAEVASVWLLLQGLIALIQLPAIIFAMVTFLIWLHRVYTNLPALRSDNTEFTPGWAVGWWFIPFANLVKPFQAVRNAWSESDPDVSPGYGFLTSVQSGAPAFMAFWWAFWLLANIVANIAYRIFEPEDMRTVELSGYFFALSGLLWAIAGVLAIKVIREITLRQDQRFHVVGTMKPQAPPPPPEFGAN
jgi:hypothetical protein